jgi:hypothetical protein
MTGPPHDWQTRRAQTRANALALLAQDVSGERAYEVILRVLARAMQDGPPPETREVQAELVAVLAAQLRQSGFEQWAQAIEKRGSSGQAFETDAYAAEVLVGRAGGFSAGPVPASASSPSSGICVSGWGLNRWISYLRPKALLNRTLAE